MRAVLCEPGKDSREIEIGGDLEAISAIVGGHIEAIYFSSKIHAYIHEEGKLIGLPWNRIVGGGLIAGPLLVMGTGQEGNERSLTPQEARAVRGFLDTRCVRLDATRPSSLEEEEAWTGRPSIEVTGW